MRNGPLEDWEYPDPDDHTEDDMTQFCHYCRRPVYYDMDECPTCGRPLDGQVPSVFTGKPWWFILLALLAVYAMIRVLLPL